MKVTTAMLPSLGWVAAGTYAAPSRPASPSGDDHSLRVIPARRRSGTIGTDSETRQLEVPMVARGISRGTRTRLAVLLAVMLLLAAGACSDDDDTAADPGYDACADWARLRDSVAALGDVDVVAEGTNALEVALDDVIDAVDQLRDSAGETIGDEVDALGSAVDDLRTEIADLPSNEGEAGAGLSAVGDAAEEVTTAADDLGEAIESGCD
jgi:hypothetical protein